MTYRRKGHAEHDNQSYVPAGEIEKWAEENDPITRYHARLTTELGFTQAEITAIDERVVTEVDAATDEAETSSFPEPLDALNGVYADPPVAEKLWYREGSGGKTEYERPEGWGVYKEEASAGKQSDG
jgi:pyruvate dehydrogenase E1 component alpha subunit/2-oxoisovalerate dehydrogenase E1 component alpha subunit